MIKEPVSKDKRFHEKVRVGVPHRRAILAELERYIATQRKVSDQRRAAFFNPRLDSLDHYRHDTDRLRASFLEMLGTPLSPEPATLSSLKTKVERVGCDEFCIIDRLHVQTLPGLNTYGMLFRPHGVKRPPLVIAQHGGQGTPELIAGMTGSSANYNDMVYRLLKHKVAVFAPQLLIWRYEKPNQRGPVFNRQQIDASLKQLGGSITALEVFQLRRMVDYFQTREDIDARRLGMIGLSYGGFYTLFTSAADQRIKAAVSSCFFNDRYIYDRLDWTWKGAANCFLDPEIASLICPRPLWIEVGISDSLFNVGHARQEAKKVSARYEALGLKREFRFKAFKGVHEFNKDDAAVKFLIEKISS